MDLTILETLRLCRRGHYREVSAAVNNNCWRQACSPGAVGEHWALFRMPWLCCLYPTAGVVITTHQWTPTNDRIEAMISWHEITTRPLHAHHRLPDFAKRFDQNNSSTKIAESKTRIAESTGELTESTSAFLLSRSFLRSGPRFQPLREADLGKKLT